MEILRYNQFVSDSDDKLSLREGLAILEDEYLKMYSEGLSESEIVENIFSNVLGSLGGGFTDTLKNHIIDWAAEKIGIIPFDVNGNPTFFYQVIRNVIEGVVWRNVMDYFGDGSCKLWSTAIVEGLIETLEERGITYLLPILGLELNMESGIGGTIAAGLRETLTNSLNDTKFMDKIENSISDKICGFTFKDILGKDLPAQAKSMLSGEISRAETKDPNIFTKITQSGLGSLIGM